MLSVYTGISNSMDHEQRPYLWHVWQGAWKLDSCTVNRLFIDDFAIKTFSRMRSEGFLFSFLGVWGWWTVCGSFSCRGALIVSSHCLWGKWKKGDVLRHVKAHFAWQAWVAIKRKVFRDSLMFTSRCLWRKCEKRECVVTCESALWSLKCEVWSVKCGVQSVQCGVWSVNWRVCSVRCEVWSVKREVWSEECEVWSEECDVWSVECEVWSGERGSESVKCEVSSVMCDVGSVECLVQAL